MSTVQVTDFPVRRDNRVNSTDTASEQTLSQFDDVDFDYTPDVTDPNKRIDTSEGNSPNINLPNT
jgi:acyl dehydratase